METLKLLFESSEKTRAWMNLIVLVGSSILLFVFYVTSTSPAALEKQVGPTAYNMCARCRVVSAFYMFVCLGNYILYVYYPLSIPLPHTFPWPRWFSYLISALIGIPSGYLHYLGVKEAGEETMNPKKGHKMHGGIYTKMRHPQGVSEIPLWWSIAFLLHSPLLVLYSFTYIPIFILMMKAEEKDLILRYGNSYIQYLKTTRFLFPVRGAAPGRESIPE